MASESGVSVDGGSCVGNVLGEVRAQQGLGGRRGQGWNERRAQIFKSCGSFAQGNEIEKKVIFESICYYL